MPTAVATTSIAESLLAEFEESIQTVRDVLPRFDDTAMAERWRLVSGDREILAQPRAVFLSNIMLSHWYQHRGQFSVYLRLLNVAVPASFGPSADEELLFLHRA